MDIDSSEVMKVKRYLAAGGWALGMLVLILDSRTAISGAAEGVQLCILTLVPSLFPFFVLAAMLTGSLSGGGLLPAGILGGYPVGAGNVAQAYRTGQITLEDAQRMVVLCNCAGPSFLFGVVGPVLGGAGKALIVWTAYLVSVLALWIVFPKVKPLARKMKPLNLQQALTNSIRAMAGVCGWVVLFRVILSVLDRWIGWIFPRWARIALYGILELTNGCVALQYTEHGIVLAAGFVAFGGVCVMLQTASVAEGISLKYYFPGKVFQCMVSILTASLFCPGTISPPVQVMTLLAAAGIGLSFRKSEKSSGNRRQIIV